MNYHVNHFNIKTWDDFLRSEASFSAFPDSARNRARRLRQGDVLLCYLVGDKVWVGALEVAGISYEDSSPSFAGDSFPVRLPVRVLDAVPADRGVPMETLLGKLSFYDHLSLTSWSGHIRRSLNKLNRADGKTLADVIHAAALIVAAEAPTAPKTV